MASKLTATLPTKVVEEASYDDDKFEAGEDEEDAEEAEENEADEEHNEEDDDDEEDEEDDEDDEEEEDEEEEDEESDEDEEPTLSIKLSREGEQTVKVFVIKKSTKRDQLAKEIAKRYNYASPKEFILYQIDESSDRVDIDSQADLKSATKKFWALQGKKKSKDQAVCRLFIRELDGVARPGTAALGVATLHHRQPSTSSEMKSPSTPFHATGSSTSMGSNMPSLNSTAKRVQWRRMATLGKGSFGTVYEGITNDGRIMAVKVQGLPMDETEESPEVKALMQEINLMRQLCHKNIVAYYGCQTTGPGEDPAGMGVSDNQRMEIFLEFCSGGSLTTIRKRYDPAGGRLSMTLSRSYTKQILEGLQYLHQRGVMHRDIKGDNVLISATGEAKLADFGCSKRVGTMTVAAAPLGNDAALYQTMVGTPLFMAPEMMSESGEGYNNGADIWSVGCLVIELMGGKPWLISGNNLFQVMYQISQSKDMPTGIPKDTPPQLMHFFTRCFERDPVKRATATELLEHPWITCDESHLQDYLSL
ncbi:protein kinase, putative [Bodo saltans]|uniref:Protein kinase, putative n=1 Tax=Bodo saltans TaxID=75058 RepID=A0A0S4J9Y8_BODSA|nr:protein kinase, putative [Bodo saltans]|eukprot:CUG88152.1 protein kinase, putative [Bodo saltans]